MPAAVVCPVVPAQPAMQVAFQVSIVAAPAVPVARRKAIAARRTIISNIGRSQERAGPGKAAGWKLPVSYTMCGVNRSRGVSMSEWQSAAAIRSA
jgi:hypothetical protein